MQRFFAAPDQIDSLNKRITLTGGDVNHIRNVLRMRPGEELWVSDGEKTEYHCAIEETGTEEILLRILACQEADYELPCRICLFQGLPKSDKLELIIQKAVELGVSEVIPVTMHRSVVKLDEKRAEKKTARWQQIADGAAKQSRRMILPGVRPVTGWKEAVSLAEKLDIVLLPYEQAAGMERTREIIEGIRPGMSIGIFVGPEGGFEPSEVEELTKKADALELTLGRRILRTETAGLALLSVLMFHLEDRKC